MPPGQLSEIRLELAGHYSLLADELQEILKIKPEKWIEIRKMVKSSAEADMLWAASEEGKREMALKWQLKVVEKLMSSIRLRLEVMSKEAQNFY